jgi:hypothetical protein
VNLRLKPACIYTHDLPLQILCITIWCAKVELLYAKVVDFLGNTSLFAGPKFQKFAMLAFKAHCDTNAPYSGVIGINHLRPQQYPITNNISVIEPLPI